MSNFSFAKKSTEVHELINVILSELSLVNIIDLQDILEHFKTFWSEYQQQSKLTIAFIGQYNAGKSTLIQALTGNSSIRISAEICTDEVTGYEWEDVLLLDTPGIYAGRTDHDSITLDYISKSDLIVFVLPNELFNPQGAAFFKKVAVEMQRAGQMILVVNKMSRETGSPDDLLKTIAQVTHPHIPKAFNPCFIDADSCLKAQNPKYAKYKERLIEKSNLLDVRLALEELIQKNKVSARLATPLHRLREILEIILDLCKKGEKINEDVLELLNRKYLILTASRTRSKNIYISQLNKLEYKIMVIVEHEVISLIDGYHEEEKIITAFNNLGEKIDELLQHFVEKILNQLKQECQEMSDKFKALMDSPLWKQVLQEIEVENFTHSSRYSYQNSNWSYSDYFSEFSFNFFKISSNIFNQLEFFAAKVSSKFVYNVGKTAMGLKGLKALKFKFFGAPKIAKVIKGFGPVLGAVGFAADFFSQVQEEEERNKQEQELKNCRMGLRQECQTVATEIKTDLAEKFKKALEFYDREIDETQQQIDQLKNVKIDENKLVYMIEIYINQIKTMINDLDS
jgi:GTPase SAR1 family protein